MYIYLRDKSARTLNLSLHPLPPSPPKRIFSTKMTFWTQKKIEFMHPYQIFQFWIFRVPFGNFFNAGRKGKPHKILFWPVVPLRGVGGIRLSIKKIIYFAASLKNYRKIWSFDFKTWEEVPSQYLVTFVWSYNCVLFRVNNLRDLWEKKIFALLIFDNFIREGGKKMIFLIKKRA